MLEEKERFSIAPQVLFRKYGRWVYRLAYLLAGDAEAAERAAIRVFQRIFPREERFSKASWKLVLAARVIENCRWEEEKKRKSLWVRLKGRKANASRVESLVLRAPAGFLSARRLEEKLFAAEAFAALGGISRKMREAVILRDIFGLKYEETAAVLSVEKVVLQKCLAEGRRLFREAMRRWL